MRRSRENPDAAPGARRLAVEILDRVERSGAWASILLDHAAARLPDSRERGLLHELVLGVLRRCRALDHAIASVASRPVDEIDPEVREALRVGAYSLFYLDRVPGFAAVDSAVALLEGPSSRFANAVLRRLSADGASHLPPEPATGDCRALALHESHPEWWTRRAVDRLGWERARNLLAASNRPAPTVLRTHTGRLTPEELMGRLVDEGLDPAPGKVVPEALRLGGGSPGASESVRGGLAWVQDEASQLVPYLLGGAGERVLDICAAPGGKTMQLAAAGHTVVACDRHRGRLRRLVALANRLGADHVMPMVADGTRPPFGGEFDGVLLDAPCSGTGNFRRRPEIRWRLKPTDLEHLALRQANLLDSAAKLVAPGAALVYSVCSIEPEEGERVITRFLEENRAFEVEDPSGMLPAPAVRLVPDGRFLHTSPLEDELDGFFAARLVRAR